MQRLKDFSFYKTVKNISPKRGDGEFEVRAWGGGAHPWRRRDPESTSKKLNISFARKETERQEQQELENFWRMASTWGLRRRNFILHFDAGRGGRLGGGRFEGWNTPNDRVATAKFRAYRKRQSSVTDYYWISEELTSAVSRLVAFVSAVVFSVAEPVECDAPTGIACEFGKATFRRTRDTRRHEYYKQKYVIHRGERIWKEQKRVRM